jgi:hypothetical protein
MRTTAWVEKLEGRVSDRQFQFVLLCTNISKVAYDSATHLNQKQSESAVSKPSKA